MKDGTNFLSLSFLFFFSHLSFRSGIERYELEPHRMPDDFLVIICGEEISLSSAAVLALSYIFTGVG